MSKMHAKSGSCLSTRNSMEVSSHQSNWWKWKTRKTLFTFKEEDSELQCSTRRIFPRKKIKSKASKHFNKVKNCHPWALSQEVHSSFPTCSTIYIGRRRWGTFSLEPHLSHWGSAHLTKPWISSENHVWRAASDLTHPNKGKLRHGQISHMNESKACRCPPQQAGGGERESKQQGTTTWQETGMLCNSQFQKRHLFFSSQ